MAGSEDEPESARAYPARSTLMHAMRESSEFEEVELCDPKCVTPPLSKFREIFTLMKFFAEQKCPGPQGARGPQGCKGAEGNDCKKLQRLIDAAVCGQIQNLATGIGEAFWEGMFDPLSEDPFKGFRKEQQADKWRLKLDPVEDDGSSELLKGQLRMHIQSSECGSGDTGVITVKPILRQVLPVRSGAINVSIARTVFEVAVGCDTRHFLITSVETQDEGHELLFVSNVQEIRSGASAHSSFEEYLLKSKEDKEDSGEWSFACKIIAGLCKEPYEPSNADTNKMGGMVREVLRVLDVAIESNIKFEVIASHTKVLPNGTEVTKYLAVPCMNGRAYIEGAFKNGAIVIKTKTKGHDDRPGVPKLPVKVTIETPMGDAWVPYQGLVGEEHTHSTNDTGY
jgi:hypothetical protein